METLARQGFRILDVRRDCVKPYMIRREIVLATLPAWRATAHHARLGRCFGVALHHDAWGQRQKLAANLEQTSGSGALAHHVRPQRENVGALRRTGRPPNTSHARHTRNRVPSLQRKRWIVKGKVIDWQLWFDESHVDILPCCRLLTHIIKSIHSLFARELLWLPPTP